MFFLVTEPPLYLVRLFVLLTTTPPGLLTILRRMGQTITVTTRECSRPEIRFFDTNRSITGMAIEVYTSATDASGERPPDVLARRLLDMGATKVTIYSNVVTVEAPAGAWLDIEPKAVHTIEHLFEFYGDDAGWSFEARGIEARPSPVQ